MIKWIGQHIWDFISRFRNDVYLESLSTTTETSALVVDSDGKVSKNITSGVNMTNGANNYIVTALGTNGLNAEANFQFNGTNAILASTGKLYFHDAGGEYISASSDGHLEINSGTTLDITAPTVDINASSAITLGAATVKGFAREIIALENNDAEVDKTLVAADSGALITINPSSSTGERPILITLPSRQAGLTFSCIVIANSGTTDNDILFTSPATSADIDGLIIGNEVSNNNITVTASSTCAFTLDTSVDNAIQYSRWTVTCDGTNWLLSDAVFKIGVNQMGTSAGDALLFSNSVLTI